MSHVMADLMAADGSAGTYLDWGVVHLSLANALIILLMIVVFVAALLVPFPRAAEVSPTRGAEEPTRPVASGGGTEADR